MTRMPQFASRYHYIRYRLGAEAGERDRSDMAWYSRYFLHGWPTISHTAAVLTSCIFISDRTRYLQQSRSRHRNASWSYDSLCVGHSAVPLPVFISLYSRYRPARTMHIYAGNSCLSRTS